MGMGPNYVLSKGHLVTGSDAVVEGTLAAADATGIKAATCDTAGEVVRGVFGESVDADKVKTGKVVANVQLLGIARVLAAGAIAVNDPVATNGSGKAVKATTASHAIFGVAMTEGTDKGYFEVLLTHGQEVPA